MAGLDYIRLDTDEPHAARGRQLLQAHPELRALAGPQWTTALWTVGLVALQLALARWLSGLAWYIWLPAAYVVGATIDHALWVVVHECCHNLVFYRPWANRAVALLANVPLVFPAAMSFCKYHLLHHRHMGDLDRDADLAGPTEARLVGRSGLRKTVWLAAMALVLGTVRPRRLRGISLLDRWTLLNAVAQVAAMGALIWWAGPGPLAFLVASTAFAVGLHPLGARWIQEHYIFHPNQETYSYYGPLNKVSFNVGYHNEHHDLMSVPWTRLPDVRRMAPEFYEPLQAHWSWTRLLVRFLSDPDTTLFSRVVRPGKTR